MPAVRRHLRKLPFLRSSPFLYVFLQNSFLRPLPAPQMVPAEAETSPAEARSRPGRRLGLRGLVRAQASPRSPPACVPHRGATPVRSPEWLRDFLLMLLVSFERLTGGGGARGE